jgi:hypothetical protein
MAIELVPSPKSTVANPDEWLIMRDALIEYTRGFMLLGLSNLNNPEKDGMADTAPFTISKGSRFDFLGEKYRCTANETILPETGKPAPNKNNFVYVQLEDELTKTAALRWSDDPPVWNTELCGWYSSDGARRALVKIFVHPVEPVYFSKIILDSYQAIYEKNTRAGDTCIFGIQQPR